MRRPSQKQSTSINTIDSTEEETSSAVNSHDATEESSQQESILPHPSTRAVARLANGLIDLEDTPCHLLNITNQNALQSPLLRLPREIRNLIWDHAIGHPRIAVYQQAPSTPPNLRQVKLAIVNGGTWDGKFLSTPSLFSVFHVPSVSRQVYSETSTLAFALCIFDFRSDVAMRRFCDRLLPAQRDAITTIAPCLDSMRIYLDPDLDDRVEPFRDRFPGLKTLYVPYGALELLARSMSFFEEVDGVLVVAHPEMFKGEMSAYVEGTEKGKLELVFEHER